MAVLLAKPTSPHEHVNDLHGDLVNLAMVLASDRAADLYDRLQRTLYTEDLFRAAKIAFIHENPQPPESPQAVETHHVARAYVYFVVSWIGRNGVSGTQRCNYQMAVRWTPGGGGGGRRFITAVESIPTWHERLRNVVILRRDGVEVIDKIEDCPGVVIYADPPYLKHTRGDGGGSVYAHDFDSIDHTRLAAALGRFQHARVVVSYYDDDALSELYPPPRWTHRRVYRNKNLHVQNRRGGKGAIAPEVLLINGPSLAADRASEPAGLFPITDAPEADE